MTATHWLSIGLFVLGLLCSAIGTALKRAIARQDRHQEAIYGEKGLFRQLADYVKREVHDVANAELAAAMDRMRSDGNVREQNILNAIEAREQRFLQLIDSREQRILDAIEKSIGRLIEDHRTTRIDISKLHERLDRIRDNAPSRRTT